jgi:hypothetical protein
MWCGEPMLPMIASPEAMPMPIPVDIPPRPVQFASTGAKLAIMSLAARQARTVASGCGNGTLKPTSRQSPEMLKIVPSCRYAASVVTAKYSLSMPTTLSTSTDSVRRVKPRRSANMATTWIRCAWLWNGPSSWPRPAMIRSARRGET